MAKRRPNETKTKAKFWQIQSAELAEFDQRLASLTPITPIAFLLIAISVAVFVPMARKGDGLRDPFSALTLQDWGANAPFLTEHHEGWRLLSAIFVHAWLPQLLCNAWTLYDLGRFMERLLGSAGFLLTFLIVGFCGNLASAIFQPGQVVAGSTGAIFGLLGALMAFVWRFRNSFPPGAVARLRVSVPAFIAFNVGYGLLTKRVDSANYLGGLVSGLVCGMLAARPLTAESAARRWRSNLLLCAMAIVLALVAPWAFNTRPNVIQEQIQLVDLEQRLTEQYQSDRAKYEDKKLSAAGFASAIEKKILPDWRQARAHLEALEGVAASDRTRWRDLRAYAKLREQAWELTADALRFGSDEAIDQAKQKEAEADRVADKMAEQDKQR